MKLCNVMAIFMFKMAIKRGKHDKREYVEFTYDRYTTIQGKTRY